MDLKDIKHYKVSVLPNLLEPNSVYYVKGPEDSIVRAFVTNKFGVAVPLSGIGINSLVQLIDFPDSYEDQGGKVLLVRNNELGVEFKSLSYLEEGIENLQNNIVLIQTDITNEINARITADSVIMDIINGLETTFISLTDTPNTYNNQASKIVVVNQTEDGLEFIDLPPSETETTTISDVTVGAVNIGDPVPENLTLEEFKNLIFNKTYLPTFSNLSFTLSNSAGAFREIGETASFFIIAQYIEGKILGVTFSGIWYPTTVQGFRTGQATNYLLNNISGGNQRPITTTVLQGFNSFQGKVIYAAGDQPLDSKGNNYLTPLLPGETNTLTTSFEGVYPLFGTTSNITTATKQALVSMISGNNIQINLVAETGGNKQFIEIPNAWLTARSLQSIQYFNTVSNQFDTTNKLADFTTSSVTKTIQGNLVNYTKYTYTGSDRANILIRLIF